MELVKFTISYAQNSVEIEILEPDTELGEIVKKCFPDGKCFKETVPGCRGELWVVRRIHEFLEPGMTIKEAHLFNGDKLHYSVLHSSPDIPKTTPGNTK